MLLYTAGADGSSTIAKIWGRAPWGKLAVVTAVFITNALLYMYVRMRQEVDATFAPEDLPSWRGLIVCALLSLVVYTVWLLLLLASSVRRFLGLSR
jgi:hypothetical protein